MVTPQVSEEVWRHAMARHGSCGGARGEVVVACPCERSVAYCCPGCGRPVFVACDPGLPTCEHGQEAQSQRGGWWGGRGLGRELATDVQVEAVLATWSAP